MNNNGVFRPISGFAKVDKNYPAHIWQTPNLSTNVDSSTKGPGSIVFAAVVWLECMVPVSQVKVSFYHFRRNFDKNRPFGPILSINWNVRLCVRPSVCPSVFYLEVLFECIFAPTFRNKISKILRHLESLGRSNEKSWSQIWKKY